MTLNYLLRKMDMYKMPPFLLVSNKKQISSNVSRLLSVLTIFYTVFVIYQLLQDRINYNGFSIVELNKQFQADEFVNVDASRFMFAVSFENKFLQANFTKYFQIYIYTKEVNYSIYNSKDTFYKAEKCTHQHFQQNSPYQFY